MMRRGLTVRYSRAASWARLVGGLALPVLALGVLGTRSGAVPLFALQPVLIVGFVLGVIGLGLAVYSLTDIWNSGAAGAGAAVAGLIYVLPVLIIIGLVAAAAVVYPRLTDITTDVDDPPLFTLDGSPLMAPDAESETLQLKAYPDIVPRLYPSAVADVYAAVSDILKAKGWTITRDVPPPVATPDPGSETTTALVVPEDDDLVKTLAGKSEMTQSRGGSATAPRRPDPAPPAAVAPDAPPAAEEVVPEEPVNVAILEATAPTLIFRFPDDVVIRMESTPDGTQVDMRSASRVGEHDLGQNARRIRGFFAELDAKLQTDPTGASGVAAVNR